jgi:hypothetical protein
MNMSCQWHLPILCSSRLHNLATEIGRDQAAISTPAGLAGSSHDALPGSYLLSETTRPSTRLIHMANLIFSWLHGRSWILTQMSPSLSPSTDRNGQDKALCITFASQFQPSLHLVSLRQRMWLYKIQIRLWVVELHQTSLQLDLLRWEGMSRSGDSVMPLKAAVVKHGH